MSTISLDPYLFFKGNCREAMEFYKGIFGGELSIMTMGESGMDENKDWIMHAMLEGGDIKLMASDGANASPEAKKVTLSLGGTDETRLREIFEKLSDGVEVQYPLKKEFWGDLFGSLQDKYGVEWMVNISMPK